MIDPTIPQPIAQTLRSRYAITSAVAHSPGMSGARVFRCGDQANKTYALRCWPDQTSSHRVCEVHAVVAQAAAGGCEFVPQQMPIGFQQDPGSQPFTTQPFTSRPITLQRPDEPPNSPELRDPREMFTTDRGGGMWDGGVWDLASWVEGKELARDASLIDIQSGAAAIGRFHSAVASLGTQMQRSPAIATRLSRGREIDRMMPRVLSVELGALAVELSPEVIQSLGRARQLLSLKWATVHRDFARLVGDAGDQVVPTQWVIRDVHREHILFTDGQVTGLIDFDSVRVDVPITDLVRWGGGFIGEVHDSGELWRAVLAGYNSESPSLQSYSVEEFRCLAECLHRYSTWISLANWMIWLAIERRTFRDGGPKVVRRIDELADQVAAEL